MNVSSQTLRNQRKNPSVLKVELATLRERHPRVMVIAVEGKEDLPVYEIWIRRVSELIRWEPIVAQGKGPLLGFRDLIARDRTGLSMYTYFIVDYDYDALRGGAETENTFLIPAYSIESYLTDVTVFESFLRTDLCVLGGDGSRELACRKFIELESQFVSLCTPACLKLYALTNCRAQNIFAHQVRKFVDVDLDSVRVKDGSSVCEAVESDVEPSEDFVHDAEIFFNSVAEVRNWIRGKYMFFFFRRMCQLFFEDRTSMCPKYFCDSARGLRFSDAILDFRNLAGRSKLPTGFADMVLQWQRQSGST